MKSKIDSIAAQWVAREDAGALSAEESRALLAWLAADKRHLGAYGRMQAIMLSCDRMYRGIPFKDTTESLEKHALRRRAGGLSLALAASLVLVAALSLLFIERHAGVHSTRVGEVARLTLDDGSELTLNTDSRVRVRYGEKRRRVELLRGEATFAVSKDPDRPFVVSAGATRVVAVGTSFNVRRSSARVEVLVSEGVVEVRERVHGQANGLRLLEGDKAVLATRMQPVVSRVDSAEVRRELAWRNGMIAFSGQTLREVALEFARYNKLRIRLADPEVEKLEVVGMFSATDPIGFSRAVAQSMHLEMALGDNEIVLRTRARGQNR